jgi:hypothetical protein
MISGTTDTRPAACRLQIQKAVNDAWRSLNPAHTPVVVLNLFIPPGQWLLVTGWTNW